MKSIGARLRAWRHANGISQDRLGQLLGVSKVTVWNWERGASEPRKKALAAISKLIENPQPPAAQSAPQMDDGSPAALPPPVLADALAQAKKQIADIAGVDPSRVTISIEY